MEALEQVMGSHSSSSTGGDDDVDCHNNSPSLSPSPTHPTPTLNFKRKRTKRLRAFSATTFPSSSSTSSLEQLLASEPTTTTTTTTTEEEEDMAHCLILLAQGRALHSPPPSGTHTPVAAAAAAEKFTSRKFTETVTTAGGKAGFYVYECKTCSKCFPSFQALGGHRASHKKPRMAVPVISTEFEVKKQAVAGTGDEDQDRHVDHVKAVVPLSSSSPPNNKARVHECSICGSEFSSGQALGGHMRRHRPIIAASGSGSSSNNNNNHHHHPHQTNNSNITGNVLSLDLNLPAPSDELNSTEVFRPMVFSSALVDCHY